MIPAAAVTATLLSIVTVGGCASPPNGTTITSPYTPPTTLLAPVPVRNDCADYAASVRSSSSQALYQQPGDLPPKAHPVSLLRCVVTPQDIPGQGQWQVVNTVRSTGPVDGFVSALRASYVKPAPTAPSSGYVCPAIGYVAQWIALIDADGTAYQIRIPQSGRCDAPDPDVLKALASVPTTIASTDRIRQTMTPGAQSSTCAQQFAEMAFVTAQANPPATTRPFFVVTNSSQDVHVCYYKIAGALDKHDPKPAGDFQYSATISGSQAAVIRDGLLNAPVATDAKACVAPATEYATIIGDGGVGDWSVVELDGCELAAPDFGPDRRAPAPVIQALLAARR